MITLHAFTSKEENGVSGNIWVLRDRIYGALKILNGLNNQWETFNKHLYLSKEAFSNKNNLT